jgi:cytochrome c556
MRSRPLTLAVAAAAAAVGTLAFGVAFAQQPSKGEQAVKYRKALYQVIVWDVGPLGAMAQDKIPFDAKDFARRAEHVAYLTPLLADAYPAESREVADTKLKPEMWSNRADFDRKMNALVDKSAALNAAAKTSDEAKMKAAFFEMGNACKDCHDKYRNK